MNSHQRRKQFRENLDRLFAGKPVGHMGAYFWLRVRNLPRPEAMKLVGRLCDFTRDGGRDPMVYLGLAHIEQLLCWHAMHRWVPPALNLIWSDRLTMFLLGVDFTSTQPSSSEFGDDVAHAAAA